MVLIYIIASTFVIVFIFTLVNLIRDNKFNGKKYVIDIRKIDNKNIDNMTRESKVGIKEMRKINKAWEELVFPLFEFQSKGINFEKQKDINNAIISYNQVIQYVIEHPQIASNHYYYSIERLVILHRKEKQYKEEISIIKFALSLNLHNKDRDFMYNRLSKAKQLLDKNTNV